MLHGLAALVVISTSISKQRCEWEEKPCLERTCRVRRPKFGGQRDLLILSVWPLEYTNSNILTMIIIKILRKWSHMFNA